MALRQSVISGFSTLSAQNSRCSRQLLVGRLMRRKCLTEEVFILCPRLCRNKLGGCESADHPNLLDSRGMDAPAPPG